jgi:hypothetical protein
MISTNSTRPWPMFLAIKQYKHQERHEAHKIPPRQPDKSNAFAGKPGKVL